MVATFSASPSPPPAFVCALLQVGCCSDRVAGFVGNLRKGYCKHAPDRLQLFSKFSGFLHASVLPPDVAVNTASKTRVLIDTKISTCCV